MGVAASALTSHSAGHGGGGGGGGWTPLATTEAPCKSACSKERKLSVVRESSQASDEGGSSGGGCHEERVLEARNSLRDLFDGKPHGRVRSASEYVVLYPAKDRGGDSGRRRSSRLDNRPSLDTSISSNTETSYVSDSSWAPMDSSGSAQGQDRDGEWPSTGRTIKRPSTSDSHQEPVSPTVTASRTRVRFFPSQPSILSESDSEEPVTATVSGHSASILSESDCEEPAKATMSGHSVSAHFSVSVSHHPHDDDPYSSDTDEDLLDDDRKVKQSLL